MEVDILVNILMVVSVTILTLLIYLLILFVKNINNSFDESEYEKNAVVRHNELTEEFLKNRFK